MRRPQTFTEFEELVLAELLSNERALPIAGVLECDDFGVPLHRSAFSELRNIEALGAPPLAELYRSGALIVAIGERMATVGQQYIGADAAPESQLLASLGLVVMRAPKYGSDFDAYFPRHVRELRAIGQQRRALWKAA